MTLVVRSTSAGELSPAPIRSTAQVCVTSPIGSRIVPQSALDPPRPWTRMTVGSPDPTHARWNDLPAPISTLPENSPSTGVCARVGLGLATGDGEGGPLEGGGEAGLPHPTTTRTIAATAAFTRTA